MCHAKAGLQAERPRRDGGLRVLHHQWPAQRRCVKIDDRRQCPQGHSERFPHVELLHRLNVDKLRKISAFYNRVNHLIPFKPTWATNILAARAVWEKYGKPLPKHSAAGVTDVRTSARRPPGNDKQFEVIQQFLSHPSLARFELNWSTTLSTMLLELIHIFNSDNEILALQL